MFKSWPGLRKPLKCHDRQPALRSGVCWWTTWTCVRWHSAAPCVLVCAGLYELVLLFTMAALRRLHDTSHECKRWHYCETPFKIFLAGQKCRSPPGNVSIPLITQHAIGHDQQVGCKTIFSDRGALPADKCTARNLLCWVSYLWSVVLIIFELGLQDNLSVSQYQLTQYPYHNIFFILQQ